MNTFRTVERVITQNIYHPKQAMYRDVEPMEGTYNLYIRSYVPSLEVGL